MFISFDYLRSKVKFIATLSNQIFGNVTRVNEEIEITGASYVFISVALCTIVFDRDIAIISLLALSICDSMAALIGIGENNIIQTCRICFGGLSATTFRNKEIENSFIGIKSDQDHSKILEIT